MSELAIRVDGLGKRYRIGGPQQPYRTLRETLVDLARAPVRRTRETRPEEIWALRDLSFEVKQGEVVGIIGRNGAGKSTLLKILSRITQPTAGRVGLRGRVGSLLEVGTGFHAELTGRENVFLNGAILGMRRHEIVRKFDEIVAFAELERFLDTPVKHYSSGMYMRLAFAVAAHLDPDILIIDEVLAVGDAQFQKKCLGRMDDVAKQGRTVLFVSHNMHVIQKLCARGIWVDRGRLHQDGPAAEVVRGYVASTASGTAETSSRGEAEIRARKIAYFADWRLEGPEPYSLRCGDELTVAFDVIVRARTRGVFFGAALWSESDTLVWAAASHDRQGSTEDLDPGRYRLRFSLGRLPLAPGSYSLEVSINTPEEQLDRWMVTPALTLTSTRTTLLPQSWQGLLDIDYHIDIQRHLDQ